MNAETSVSHSNSELDADVIIVGAGPTGLTTGIALLRGGVSPLILDQLPERQNTSRAAVVHAHTLEKLEPLGVTNELLDLGLRIERFSIRDRDRVLMPINFSRLDTKYPYVLMLPQVSTEEVLIKRYRELGGRIIRPVKCTSVNQDTKAVQVLIEDGRRFRASYLVGADGMHSMVREQTGISFRGKAYAETFVLADVHLEAVNVPDEVMLFFSPAGMVVLAPLPRGQHRIVVTTDDAFEEADVEWLQTLLDTRGPSASRLIVRDVIWTSRFRIHHRIARRYREGRILLAGDAAHVHSPAGGQGMNAGIIDATTLAAALVSALRGKVSALDEYGDDRRPVARKVIALADRLTRLATAPEVLRPVRNLLLRALGSLPAWRNRLALELSGLRYR